MLEHNCIPLTSYYFPNQSPSLHFSYSGKLKNEHIITIHVYFLCINKLMYLKKMGIVTYTISKNKEKVFNFRFAKVTDINPANHQPF